MRRFSIFVIAILFLFSSKGTAFAADFGSIKPTFFGPSRAFPKNETNALHHSLAAGVGSAFTAAVLNELFASSHTSKNQPIWVSSGFFVNLSSGIGTGTLRGRSVSDLNVLILGGSTLIGLKSDSSGRFSSSEIGSVPGISAGYHLRFEKLVFGAVIDGNSLQSRSEKTIAGLILSNPNIVAQPMHRVASNLQWMSSANARVGWMLNDRLMFYAQGGPAVAHAVVGAGLAEPAGLIWKQQNRMLIGVSSAIGFSYQGSTSWILGVEASSAWFRPVSVYSSGNNSRFLAGATFRHRHNALKLSIGRQL